MSVYKMTKSKMDLSPKKKKKSIKISDNSIIERSLFAYHL